MNKFSIFNFQFLNYGGSIPNLRNFKFGHWKLFRNLKLEIRNYSLIGLVGLISLIGLISHIPEAKASGLIKPANNLGLVGYWSFEDATGTVATDFSGKGHTGTFVNSIGWQDGKRGKAVAMNVTGGDYIQAPTLRAADSLDSAGSFAFWFKGDALSSTNETIISTHNWDTSRDGFVATVRSNAGLYVELDSASASQGVAQWTEMESGRYYHCAGTWDGSLITLYVNGAVVATSTQTVTPATTINPLRLGENAAGSSRGFAGILDEVRIYNRALGATEVAALYNTNSRQTILSGSQNLRGPQNGLVGLWSFDGKDVYNTTAYDRSGQSNTATLQGGVTKVNGKLGQALQFDGADDWVNAGSASAIDLVTGDYTLTAWVKPNVLTGNQAIIAKSASSNDKAYSLMLGGSEVYVDGENGGNDAYVTTTGAGLVVGNWYHLAATMTSSTLGVKIYVNGVEQATTGSIPVRPIETNADLVFGSVQYAGTYYNGFIDEVRIYNRVLSTAEISQLYNLGQATVNKSRTSISDGLVLWHTFDGTKLNTTTSTDSINTAYNGTLTGANGKPIPVQGKVGQALQFDGVDDFISVPATALSSEDMTMAVWVKISSAPTNNGNIFERDFNTGYRLRIDNDRAITFYYYNGALRFAGGNSVALNEWTHLVVTGTTEGVRVYKNGSQIGTNLTDGAFTGTSADGDSILSIGAGESEYFNGLIDDARIYNRAITAAEVRQLYDSTK